MNAQVRLHPTINRLPKISSLRLSFEFFPARNTRMEHNLWRTMGQLELLNPEFFSMTYGALGSARDHSISTVATMCQQQPVPVAAHLTAAGHTRDYMLELAGQFHESGVQRIVALRGDADGVPDGVTDVAEMVQSLKAVADFDISVAAYPEVHPKAASAAADMAHLKRKLDAGASRALTQYFFEADVFLRFRDDAVKAGIEQPIVPGILPVNDLAKVESFSARCGANVPDSFKQHFAGTEAGSIEQQQVGIEQSLKLCETLIAEGVDALHFYTLNLPNMSFEVARHLCGETFSASIQKKAA
ncbi:MAG: methylenetetrahydrofolate reductase [Thiolinea sp.]